MTNKELLLLHWWAYEFWILLANAKVSVHELKLDCKCVRQQDGDPKHTNRSTKNILSKRNLNWTSRSYPNTNVVEGPKKSSSHKEAHHHHRANALLLGGIGQISSLIVGLRRRSFIRCCTQDIANHSRLKIYAIIVGLQMEIKKLHTVRKYVY